jgi:IMP dehydrogenase
MENNKIIGDGLTYDDVLLVPNHSQVLPRNTVLSTRLTNKIMLNLPLLSAAMDSVTESRMAVAIAREGGLGVIHKNFTIEEQVEQVDKVKRSESGMIRNPITLTADKKVADALRLMAKFHISGIPIVDNDLKLIGIITNRDLRFNPNLEDRIGDVMTKSDLATAPVGTNLETAELLLQKHKFEKLPVVDENNKLCGLITFKDIQKKKNASQCLQR